MDNKQTKAEADNSPIEKEKHQDGTIEAISDEKRKRLIEKIKKMLHLAQNNPSMEEGLSAALQAHKLMAKYNIHEDDVTLEEVKDEITSVFSNQPHDSHLLRWRKTLGLVVSRAFRCKCYLKGRDIVFRGYKNDAQLAMDVYTMLYAVGHKVARKEEFRVRKETGTAKGIYGSTIAGFVRGVEDALNKQCTALMVITPKEIEDDWIEFSTNFKKTKTCLKVHDAEAYHKGYVEGKDAVHSRSIEQKREKVNEYRIEHKQICGREL